MAKSNTSLLKISQLATAAQWGFDLIVQRSLRRRTLEVQVHEGVVKALIPQWVSRAELITFVSGHQHWLRKTVEEQRRKLLAYAKAYRQDETFLFLGKPYRLRIQAARRCYVRFADDCLFVNIAPRANSEQHELVRKTLWRWYQQQAEQILSAKTVAMAAQIQRPYQKITLRKTKTKWGHCTSAGVIQYNWQIILAPEAVVDYLVAHEVSHLRHQNHSANFWRQVAQLCPDFKIQRRWLQENALQLTL